MASDTKRLQLQLEDGSNGTGLLSYSLEKPPDLDPFIDDLTRNKSAKSSKNTLKRAFFDLFC